VDEPSSIIDVSHRDLAERAGVALSTVEKNLPEMKKVGELRYDNLHRKPEEAGTFVLLIPESANSAHPTTDSRSSKQTGVASVPDLRVLRRLRHGAPRVWRLGPRAGMAVLALLRSGGELLEEGLASMLGLTRPRDLRRKGGVLERMTVSGIVECSDGMVSLDPSWREALAKAREAGLEEDAERLKELFHRFERANYAYKRDPSDETRKHCLETVEQYQEMRSLLRQKRPLTPVTVLSSLHSILARSVA
jgi:hypothetical protein